MTTKLLLTTTLLMAAPTFAAAQEGQTTIDRIEKMPRIPTPYLMRDWKDVTRGYIDLVLNPHEGDHLPLSSVAAGGNNYPEYQPLRIDTYVGWNAHSAGAEAINVMPAVISAYITGNESRTPYHLAEGVLDFFNKKNRQNVYLNGFSSSSGSDWWYDAMPNVYFLQLAAITDELPADIVKEQTEAIASQWMGCVSALGGNSYRWDLPYMNYRAFNLYSMKPLTKGVKEPESAGSVAWILYHAYLRTHNEAYRRGAELALEYLNSVTQNPAYELQLAYGVQMMALMNAQYGAAFDTERFFTYCFDRGWLRGWGSIVGNWGGYDMSGLIGEANDGGNDYAFVMNGFQQVGALAPAVKYDKRLARAYARWVLNVANASRYFYPGFLPAGNCEQTSLDWSRTYDAESVIPYESIKENYDGRSPLAMGDALKGKWASTNLSLYSGSSVGMMAAVVGTTDVEAILDLDLDATDFTASHRPHRHAGSTPAPLSTHLYYNPYDEERTVTLALPEGRYRIYDALNELFLTDEASGTYTLALPADEARQLVFVPSEAEVHAEGRRLLADATVIDWHYGQDFSTPLRVKNLEMHQQYIATGDAVVARATASSDDVISYVWTLDGTPVVGQHSATFYHPSYGLSDGRHILAVTIDNGTERATDKVAFSVNDHTGIKVPTAIHPAQLTYDLSGRRATTHSPFTIVGNKKCIR